MPFKSIPRQCYFPEMVSNGLCSSWGEPDGETASSLCYNRDARLMAGWHLASLQCMAIDCTRDGTVRGVQFCSAEHFQQDSKCLLYVLQWCTSQEMPGIHFCPSTGLEHFCCFDGIVSMQPTGILNSFAGPCLTVSISCTFKHLHTVKMIWVISKTKNKTKNIKTKA